MFSIGHTALVLTVTVYDRIANMRLGVQSVQPEGVATDLFDVFQSISNLMLTLISAVAVVMLIIGGFRYVVSGGNSSSIEGAKNTILYAIIGIVVAFLAYAAINFLTAQLEG